jgi:hypothetical protein
MEKLKIPIPPESKIVFDLFYKHSILSILFMVGLLCYIQELISLDILLIDYFITFNLSLYLIYKTKLTPIFLNNKIFNEYSKNKNLEQYMLYLFLMSITFLILLISVLYFTFINFEKNLISLYSLFIISALVKNFLAEKYILQS